MIELNHFDIVHMDGCIKTTLQHKLFILYYSLCTLHYVPFSTYATPIPGDN